MHVHCTTTHGTLVKQTACFATKNEIYKGLIPITFGKKSLATNEIHNTNMIRNQSINILKVMSSDEI